MFKALTTKLISNMILPYVTVFKYLSNVVLFVGTRINAQLELLAINYQNTAHCIPFGRHFRHFAWSSQHTVQICNDNLFVN